MGARERMGGCLGDNLKREEGVAGEQRGGYAGCGGGEDM